MFGICHYFVMSINRISQTDAEEFLWNLLTGFGLVLRQSIRFCGWSPKWVLYPFYFSSISTGDASEVTSERHCDLFASWQQQSRTDHIVDDIVTQRLISLSVISPAWFLWSPYGIGQTIMFLPCGYFFLSSSSFLPRLISAVADWMSAILPHMVWP